MTVSGLQGAVCGAKNFFVVPICLEWLNYLLATVKDQPDKLDNLLPGKIESTETVINLGDIPAHSYKEVKIEWSDAPTHAYDIEFMARNGGWEQKLRFAYVDRLWLMASRIERGKKVLMENSSPGFP